MASLLLNKRLKATCELCSMREFRRNRSDEGETRERSGRQRPSEESNLKKEQRQRNSAPHIRAEKVMVGSGSSDCFTHGGSPSGLMFEHGIQSGNELAHASGERHLRCFPGCTEALVESLEIRIKTYSDESEVDPEN
jgi:hypothetical protein